MWFSTEQGERSLEHRCLGCKAALCPAPSAAVLRVCLDPDTSWACSIGGSAWISGSGWNPGREAHMNPSKMELAWLPGPVPPFLVGKLRPREVEPCGYVSQPTQQSWVPAFTSGHVCTEPGSLSLRRCLGGGSGRGLFWAAIPGRKEPVPCASIYHLLCVSGGPRFHFRPSLGSREAPQFLTPGE